MSLLLPYVEQLNSFLYSFCCIIHTFSVVMFYQQSPLKTMVHVVLFLTTTPLCSKQVCVRIDLFANTKCHWSVWFGCDVIGLKSI